ncbi:unnamed protein product, partial [marine sediment metagenome]
MRLNGKTITYSAAHARKVLAIGKPAPPMVIIACNTGRFEGHENCLAESLLLMPAGPVAVVAATTESHELTNYFVALCLSQQLGEKNKRFGSIWLAAQHKAINTRDIIMERILCNADEKADLAKVRRDHILMYALLGDPATPLHLPDRLHASVKYTPGTWHWDVPKPQGATKLYAGLRPSVQVLSRIAPQSEKAAALKLFQQANDTFAFKPLREFAADE